MGSLTLASELFALAPRQFARMYSPIAVASQMSSWMPLQWKKGRCEHGSLNKVKDHSAAITNRELLLVDQSGISTGSVRRRRVAPLADMCSADRQHGHRLSGGTCFIVALALLLQKWLP